MTKLGPEGIGPIEPIGEEPKSSQGNQSIEPLGGYRKYIDGIIPRLKPLDPVEFQRALDDYALRRRIIIKRTLGEEGTAAQPPVTDAPKHKLPIHSGEYQLFELNRPLDQDRLKRIQEFLDKHAGKGPDGEEGSPDQAITTGEQVTPASGEPTINDYRGIDLYPPTRNEYGLRENFIIRKFRQYDYPPQNPEDK